MNSAVERLWQEIEAREDELIEIVAELVRRPSLLGQEAEVQAYVADHLQTSDLEVSVWDLPAETLSEPNAGDSGVPFPGRPNVTGRKKGAGGGRSLIINGHVDVVSPEPVAAWTYDPWRPTIVGDRMYGRGAFDMKSGDAINLFLPRAAARSRDRAARRSHHPQRDRRRMHGKRRARRLAASIAPTPPSSPSRPAAASPTPMSGCSGSASGSVASRGTPCRPGAASMRSRSPSRSCRRCSDLDARLNENVHPAFAGDRAPDQPQHRGDPGWRLAQHSPRCMRAALPGELLPRPDRR